MKTTASFGDGSGTSRGGCLAHLVQSLGAFCEALGLLEVHYSVFNRGLWANLEEVLLPEAMFQRFEGSLAGGASAAEGGCDKDTKST